MDSTNMVNQFSGINKGKEVAKEMSSFVNRFALNRKEFVNALKEDKKEVQNLFSKVAFTWVVRLDYLYRKNWYDGRNEYSAKTCFEIKTLLGSFLENALEGYNGESDSASSSFEVDFAEQMSTEHRTLQQSFTSLVFEWFLELETSKADEVFKDMSKEILKEFPSYFASTPLI